MHSAHGAVYFQNLLSSQNFEKLSHLSPPLSSSESLSFISKCEMAKTILFSSNNNDLIFCFIMYFVWGFPCGSAGKESTCHAGDPGSIPGSGRSPGEGIGYLLQDPCLENSTKKVPDRLQSMVLERVGHN